MMNENIKEIWNKAASSHQQESTSWETKSNFLTRFAQLVAERCAKIADTSDPKKSSALIKEHFGIK